MSKPPGTFVLEIEGVQHKMVVHLLDIGILDSATIPHFDLGAEEHSRVQMYTVRTIPIDAETAHQVIATMGEHR